MSEDDTTTGTGPAEATAPPRARRARTRKTAAAGSTSETGTAGPTADTGTDASAADTGTDASAADTGTDASASAQDAAPAAPKRRRATKKAVAPVPAEAPEPPAAVDAPGAGEPHAPRRRRAARSSTDTLPPADQAAPADALAHLVTAAIEAPADTEPEAAEPATIEPATIEPGVGEPGAEESESAEPEVDEPAVTGSEPVTAEPAVAPSAAAPPSAASVTSAEPVRMKPLTPEALLAAVERQRQRWAAAAAPPEPVRAAAPAAAAPPEPDAPEPAAPEPTAVSTTEVQTPATDPAESPAGPSGRRGSRSRTRQADDDATPTVGDDETDETVTAPPGNTDLADERPAVFVPAFVAPEQQSRFTRRPERPERSDRPERSRSAERSDRSERPASRSGRRGQSDRVPAAAPVAIEDVVELPPVVDGHLIDEPIRGGEQADEQFAGDEPDATLDGQSEETGARRKRRRRGGRGRRRVADDGETEGAEPVDGDDPAEESSAAEDTGSERVGVAGSGDDTRSAAESDAEGQTGTADQTAADEDTDAEEPGDGTRRRRRRRHRGGSDSVEDSQPEEDSESSTRVREPRRRRSREGTKEPRDPEVASSRGSTRLEAKRVRRKEGRDASRRRPPILTEAEFLARRESVARTMLVREKAGRTQIAVLEDDILVEHYIAENASNSERSMIGDVYLGRVQNVLPAMEAAFIDIGRGRNGVLYAGEVNWDGAGLDGKPKRIELALKSGQPVLVQVTKDPIGHKGARLTAQISLAGRYLVYVPNGSMSGISRKLPDVERARLKKILKELIPSDAGVIVRTAAEGATEEELTADVERLKGQWAAIEKKAKGSAPNMLQGEPDLAVKVVRDIFNSDFAELYVTGDAVRDEVVSYVQDIAPTLVDRVHSWSGPGDLFAQYRVDEQLAKALDRKVWLPSGGSLVIDRTEAMTVVDVNTGRFTGSGGNLEETVTENNLEAAEELVRQLRLRDIGGIIVVDFIDMVFEANRDLVVRRLVECLGRDRTRHQVAEVSSLGLVQMTRKRIGRGLLEVFSQPCEVCRGRGVVVDLDGAPHGAHENGSTAPAAVSAIPNPGDTHRLHQRNAMPPPSASVTGVAAEAAADTTLELQPAPYTEPSPEAELAPDTELAPGTELAPDVDLAVAGHPS